MKIPSKVNEFIDQILESNGAWVKPWLDSDHCNAVTGREYHGVNSMLLAFIAGERGYKSNKWMTFNQANELGLGIKTGSKSVPVVFWKMLKKKDAADDKDVIPMLAYFNVFNLDCINGDISKFESVATGLDEKPSSFDGIIKMHGITIEHKGTQAYYSPSRDVVSLPDLKWFKGNGPFTGSNQYAQVLAHEITHWTGHSSRLNRLATGFNCNFGSLEYSKEELVAELGSIKLCAKVLGDDAVNLANSVAYLNGWVRGLKDKKAELISAFGRADKAVKFLLTGELNEVQK